VSDLPKVMAVKSGEEQMVSWSQQAGDGSALNPAVYQQEAEAH
jgi:hypothetical protein